MPFYCGKIDQDNFDIKRDDVGVGVLDDPIKSNRNNPNSPCCNNNCINNFSGSIHKPIVRRKWTNNKSKARS